MALFALKDIPAGTEIHYDYNFQTYNNDAQVNKLGLDSSAFRVYLCFSCVRMNIICTCR